MSLEDDLNTREEDIGRKKLPKILFQNIFAKLLSNVIYSTLAFIMNIEKITRLLYIE